MSLRCGLRGEGNFVYGTGRNGNEKEKGARGCAALGRGFALAAVDGALHGAFLAGGNRYGTLQQYIPAGDAEGGGQGRGESSEGKGNEWADEFSVVAAARSTLHDFVVKVDYR